MTDPSVDRDPVDLLAEDFARRIKAGEGPTIDDYAARHPEHAADIRAVFPALRLLAELDPARPDPGEAPGWASGALPRIAGYEIRGEVGRGGMGVVYRARHERLDRIVALKMILAGDLATADALERFRSEAVALARIQHRHVVQVFHVGEQDGRPFLEMEYLPGGSLGDRQAGRPLPAAEVLRMGRQLAEGVAQAHRIGVIHRDLKPANILFAADGALKVADFGLAKMLGEEAGATRTHSILGSPSYMAPEQARGRTGEVGPAADVHAVGAILYELLTGRPPFRGATVLETLAQVKDAEPVPPSRLLAAIPRDLETIVLACLHKDPARRYASAAELAEDLARFAAGEPIRSRRSGPVGRAGRWCRRHPAIAGLWAALGVALGGGFVGMAILTRLAGRNEAEARRLAGSERAARVESQRISAELALSKGQALADQGYVGRGLLWMGEALRIAPPEVEPLRRAVRRNLAAWVPRAVSPRAILPAPSLRVLALRPDGRHLATGSDDGMLRLWDVASGRLVAQVAAHRDGIHALTFAPDGRSLASSGELDGMARLWSDEDLRPLPLAVRHVDGGWVVARFAPDGRSLLTVGRNNFARLWHVETGRPAGPEIRQDGASDVRIGPDGARVALLGRRTARLWDPTTGMPAGPPLEHPHPIGDAAFSPDGRHLATADASTPDERAVGPGRCRVRIWDPGQGRILAASPESRLGFTRLAYHPGGERLAAAGLDDVVRLLGAADAQAVGSEMPHLDDVDALAFSPDGRALATGSRDGTSRLYDATDGRPLGAILEHGGDVVAVAFAGDGRALATASRDGTARSWDTAPLASPARLASPPAGVESLAVRPGGAALATGGRDGTIRLADEATGRPLAPPWSDWACARAVRFSPDGRLLASGSDTGEVTLWQLDPPRRLGQLVPRGRRVVNLRFSDDGRMLLVGRTEGVARLYDVANRRAIGRVLKHPNRAQGHEVGHLAFRPDGRTAITGSNDGTLMIWDAATGQPLGRALDFPPGILQMALAPGGRELLVLAGGQVHRLDLDARRELAPPFGANVRAFALAPDGRAVLTGGSDRTARLWDLASGRETGPAMDGDGDIHAVAIAPDGDTFLEATSTGQLRFRDAATGKPIGPALEHPRWSLPLQPDDRAPIAFLPGGREAISVGGSVLIWPVPGGDEAHQAPLGALTGLEFAAEGRPRSIEPERWMRLLDESPPAALSDEAWHRRAAAISEIREQDRALLWHLDRLVAADPDDAVLRGRRAGAAGRVGAATADAASPPAPIARAPTPHP